MCSKVHLGRFEVIKSFVSQCRTQAGAHMDNEYGVAYWYMLAYNKLHEIEVCQFSVGATGNEQ